MASAGQTTQFPRLVRGRSAVTRLTIDAVRRYVRKHLFAVTLIVSLIAFLIITEQVLWGGPMVSLDYWVHNRRIDLRHPEFFDTMYYLVMMGQRAPSAKLAYVIVGILAWRRRSWRPLLVLTLALFALNGFVGVLKLLTSRLRPADGSAAVFSHIGDIYPSGHASNVVVTWGIVAYILVRYGPLRTYRPGVVISSAATFIVGIASIYLDTHWVSDILAGWLAGAIILLVAVKIDLEYEALTEGVTRWVRRVTEVDQLDERRFAVARADLSPSEATFASQPADLAEFEEQRDPVRVAS
jgi:membrane-associated phospholipid phosphatase